MGALDAGALMLPQALVMGVVAPISGRLYDRFGPRWVAFSGLVIAAIATNLMTGLNLNVTKGQIIFWTCLRAVGQGLAMMSVTSSGIASLSPRIVASGTAFNNIVQRVSSALGLAALSAMVTGMEAQFAAARYGLIPSGSPMTSGMGLLQLYQLATQTNYEVMATSFVNVFKITTWFTIIGAILCLGLRAGKAEHTAGEPAMMAD